MALTFALSILCENPLRRTGLTTLFHEFVSHALRQHPEIRWVIFAGPQQPWTIVDERVEVVRDFPSNERKLARLRADHFAVGPAARVLGATALLTVGFLPLRTGGLPVVMHLFSLHHTRPGGGLGARYRRWAVRRGLHDAALVIVNSAWARAQLGAVQTPVLVSYEGMQHDRFRPEGAKGAEVRTGLPPEYVLWASNFYGYKRAPLALLAYARLPAAARKRFPLVLAGGDWAGGRAEAERTADKWGIGADTHFLGWVSDEELPALYRGARAHLLATSEETFGRSVAEAMACGCPCVLQDLPVLREVAGEAALFCDFADTATAGMALEKICTDDALAARLRTAGLERARAFSFEKLARERVAAIVAAVEKSR